MFWLKATPVVLLFLIEEVRSILIGEVGWSILDTLKFPIVMKILLLSTKIKEKQFVKQNLASLVGVFLSKSVIQTVSLKKNEEVAIWHDDKRIENDDYNIAKMKTINSSELLNILRDSVAMKNVQEPMIVVTNNTKRIVVMLRSTYTHIYSICMHPKDENKSYYFQQPAECDLYYFCYTRFNEFGDLQYAIDIATKGHKTSVILLDNNTEIQYFPKDILNKYLVYSLDF